MRITVTVTDEPGEDEAVKADVVRDPALRQMIADYPEFPDFLRDTRTPEQRRAEWAALPVTVQGSNQSAADRAERGRSVAAALEEERREHNARGLERLKKRHHGERYDRKTRTWVPLGENVQSDRQPDSDVLPEVREAREGGDEDGR